MDLMDQINKFYFTMSINELRLMNNQVIRKDITYNSRLYLDIISYQENCTVTFLANAMNVSKSAVTIKVNELIKQGLVTKTQSDKDKRVFYLNLNECMVKEYGLYDDRFQTAIEEIDAKYTKQDIDKFCGILEIICKNFII